VQSPAVINSAPAEEVDFAPEFECLVSRTSWSWYPSKTGESWIIAEMLDACIICSRCLEAIHLHPNKT
jgi:hypothetical protein